jgi:hypothetical protein
MLHDSIINTRSKTVKSPFTRRRPVAQLLPLLRQGTDEKQEAFSRLRDSLARSIHPVQPRDELPYAIYTDVSKLGISSVLNQKSDSEETLVVSTAPSVDSRGARDTPPASKNYLSMHFKHLVYMWLVIRSQYTPTIKLALS